MLPLCLRVTSGAPPGWLTGMAAAWPGSGSQRAGCNAPTPCPAIGGCGRERQDGPTRRPAAAGSPPARPARRERRREGAGGGPILPRTVNSFKGLPTSSCEQHEHGKAAHMSLIETHRGAKMQCPPSPQQSEPVPE